jgi:uncharacterized membrane protein SpoIIM required for sporulation
MNPVNFDTFTDLLIFFFRHATVLELPAIILCAAVGAYLLSRELDKHNARLREAKFARRTAAFYAALFLVSFLAHYLL